MDWGGFKVERQKKQLLEEKTNDFNMDCLEIQKSSRAGNNAVCWGIIYL